MEEFRLPAHQQQHQDLEQMQAIIEAEKMRSARAVPPEI